MSQAASCSSSIGKAWRRSRSTITITTAPTFSMFMPKARKTSPAETTSNCFVGWFDHHVVILQAGFYRARRIASRSSHAQDSRSVLFILRPH